MAIVQLPANLILLHPRTGFRGQTRAHRTASAPIVSRRELLDRLETIGELAPHAPLSFLLVRVEGLDAVSATAYSPRQIMGMIGMRIIALTRPTDTVGEFAGNAFGIVLQGAGATAAAAVASRVTFHLAQLRDGLGIETNAVVYAATGNGLNAELLPVAAIDSLDDCC
jgi:GGDEF domain-containing protein